MAVPEFSKGRFIASVEPVLADAVERGTTAGLAVLRDFATFHTSANLELFKPAQIFQSFVRHFPPSSFSVNVEHVRDERVGDEERMSACVAALIKAMVRGPGTTLDVSIYEKEEHSVMVSRMAINFNGPGQVPEEFVFGGHFPMTLATLSDCWTLATSGGRIDRTETGVELRLDGMRMPPEPLEIAQEVLVALGREPGQGDAERALRLIEDQGAPEMADLERVYLEAASPFADGFERRGIVHRPGFSGAFPPLPLNRKRMHAFFSNVFAWALDALPRGGTLETLVEYEHDAREAAGMITLSGPENGLRESFHLSIMKRAIRFHGGTMDVEWGNGEVTLSFTLPDGVGRALDGWLPGWEAFGPEPQKFLRLLQCGAPAPPEEFILGGILEQELERWLLPRLSEPVATNLANEGNFRNDGLKGSIRERLQKALEQVGRGKPKKEICQPQYAGELLWAFRNDPRQRYALGTQVLLDSELQDLAEGLLAKPVDFRATLIRLAVLLGRSGDGA